MDDDAQMLQQFVEARSQAAFGQLVGRHVHGVYSACLRQLRDPTTADQATQAVFVLLARQAGRLKRETSLVPWLWDAAHRVCRISPLPGNPEGGGEGPAATYSSPSDWSALAPQIDAAIASLPSGVREAFLLKYVANFPLRDVANALGVADNQAGQRISEGVARLRRYYESHNLFIAPDALVASIQAHAVHAAPPAVAYNAALAANGLAGAPPPAVALADSVAGAQRRSQTVRLASAACVVLILSLGVFKVYSAVKTARLASTQPAVSQPAAADGSASPATKPPPQAIPTPEKPLPVAKAIKPVEPEFAARTIAAIRQSDIDALQQLLDRDENVINARDAKTGRTAVEVAADLVAWNRPDATRIAHFLIENGAVTDIHTAARAGHANYVALRLLQDRNLLESKDAQGLTPLQRAALLAGASPDCEEVVDMLIRVGANVDLWTACTFGRLTDVQQALADHAGQINEPRLGATPLNWATRPRRYADDPLAIPRLLLDRGADPRSRDTANDGMTPLHHAAAWGAQAAVAGLLIERGVDVNIPDDYGWTPLDYAIDRGRKEMVEFFKSKGGRRTTLEYPDRPAKTARFFAAVQIGDTDLTHRLLDDTPELAKARGPTGETPLHWAAANGSIAIIDLLLADKADINAHETNKFGGTPLHWAVRHDRLDAIKHLLEKGADPRTINQRSGQTLLQVAAQHTDDAALIDLLLGQGIIPTAKDRFGKMAADYAASAGHTHVLERLSSVH
jgi:ankyrin repeat protein/DNA-directed RNA polymerase specialized sigma24 family protein